MARNELVIAAPPATVWEVLATPQLYGYWVVGSSEIRESDDSWPRPGARFHHRVGVKPLTLADHTEVIEAVPPRRLVLRAKARPLGVARVTLQLEPHPAGTLVTMVEDPDPPAARLVFPPVLHAVVRLRNGESLRRLRTLAEARTVEEATSAPPAARTRRPSPQRRRRGAAR